MIKRYSHPALSTKSPENPISELFPIVSADQLLAEKHRQNLLARIQHLAAAPKDHYQALYANLITNFAAFVQQLPHADHATFTLLDYHLAVCDTALALRIPFLAQEKTWTIAQQQEALWHYVIFSSALLHNIGRLVTRYSVALCNEKGHFIAPWEPFLGSMNEQAATHYRVQNIFLHNPPHTAKVSQLLAMQLMPRDGFLWIASDPDALAAWLEAVEGQAGGGGIVLQLLKASENEVFKRAREQRLLDAMIDTEHLDHMAQKLDVASHEILGIAPPLHGKLSKDTAIGEAFFNWLKNGLHTGEIAVNTPDAMVHMTEDGVFLLYPPIFESFSKAYPRFRDWAVVYRQFNHLGLAPLSGSDFVFAKYFSEHPDVSAHKESQRMATQSPLKFLQSTLFKSALSEHMPQHIPPSQITPVAPPPPITPPVAAPLTPNPVTTTTQTYAGLLVDPKFIFANHMPPNSPHVQIQHPVAEFRDNAASIHEASRQFYEHKSSHQAVTTFFSRLQNSQYPALRFFTPSHNMSAFFGFGNKGR